MSALTPDCDPDLSTCGSPTGSNGGGVRSTVVLLALVSAAVLAVTGDAVPGVVAFPGRRGGPGVGPRAGRADGPARAADRRRGRRARAVGRRGAPLASGRVS